MLFRSRYCNLPFLTHPLPHLRTVITCPSPLPSFPSSQATPLRSHTLYISFSFLFFSLVLNSNLRRMPRSVAREQRLPHSLWTPPSLTPLRGVAPLWPPVTTPRRLGRVLIQPHHHLAMRLHAAPQVLPHRSVLQAQLKNMSCKSLPRLTSLPSH